jgi:hypothetical protein
MVRWQVLGVRSTDLRCGQPPDHQDHNPGDDEHTDDEKPDVVQVEVGNPGKQGRVNANLSVRMETSSMVP